MKQVYILEDNDILQENDWCRQLGIAREGQSDIVSDWGTYGGQPINRMKWIPVSIILPYWVGKTVGEYNNGLDKLIYYHPKFEFLRGELPKHHIETYLKHGD